MAQLRGSHRSWVVVLGSGILCALVFSVIPAGSLVHVGAFLGPLLVADALLVIRLWQGELPRRVGGVLLAGQLVYLAGTLPWALRPVLSRTPAPFPSWVDLTYIVAYALLAAFLVLVLRERAPDRSVESRLAAIDAAILTLSMSSVLWVTVMQPSLSQEMAPLATVTALAYPASTLVLFALAARLLVSGPRLGSVPAALLLVWAGTEVAADALYAVQSAAGTFAFGGVDSALWIVSYAALGALVVHPHTAALLAGGESAGHVHAAPSKTSRLGRVVRPGMLVVAAVAPTAMVYVADMHQLYLLLSGVLAVSLVTVRGSLLAGDLDVQRRLTADLAATRRQLQASLGRLELQSQEMERLAYSDPVTGLGNRELLRERARTVPTLEGAALLLLDLDGFKEVNDTLGHALGDALLLQVGDRLGRCVRSGDTVVRLGGDEFVLLLPDTGVNAAGETAERILAEIRGPFDLDGTTVRVRGSIGIAATTEHAELDELLRNADLAMYEAKSAGRDRACVFDPRMYERAARRRELEGEIGDALAAGDFTVHYQPIVTAATGEVAAVEALVRWDHRERGVLPPFEFLAVAERAGLVVDLGRFVLRTACAQVVEWRRDWPDLSVAVNVSHAELLHADFAASVLEVLSDTGLPAEALSLEVTETVLAAEENIATALAPLVAQGVRLSIDDFGTGHSSLSRLRRLNANRLKIDKSFIAEIGDETSSGAPLLTSIITLAHSVGHRVVAEGVETPAQAAFLTANGCDELQGYLFSRPVGPGQAISVLLATGMMAHGGGVMQAVFSGMVERVMDPSVPVSSVLPPLLRELRDLAGVDCCFVTEVRGDPREQVTRVAANADPEKLRIAPGLAVAWGRTLCSRMIADKVLWTSDVQERYGDVPAVQELGIATYVTVPMRDDDGELRGTLCAASSRRQEVPSAAVHMLRLFAQALADRLGADTWEDVGRAGSRA